MSWLIRLLSEDLGTMIPMVVRAPNRDRRAGPILDLTLEALCVGLPMAEALLLREERAAILEYEGGLPRPIADSMAGVFDGLGLSQDG